MDFREWSSDSSKYIMKVENEIELIYAKREPQKDNAYQKITKYAGDKQSKNRDGKYIHH